MSSGIKAPYLGPTTPERQAEALRRLTVALAQDEEAPLSDVFYDAVAYDYDEDRRCLVETDNGYDADDLAVVLLPILKEAKWRLH